MPTSTDLVTDLPADFEVFGQAVATSMADLLGGTTGQVLAKASNTDMDFSWVAQDDSNAIQNAIVDAKGDLIGATAADTPARLAVGTNGQVLTADSTAATGLAWATASTGSSYVAGKNGILNSNFSVAQRGTSFAAPTTNTYTLDRFIWQSSSVASKTVSQQSSGLTGIQYSMRVARDSGNTNTAANYIGYSFETIDSYRFAGQTVTFSFYAKAGANYSPTSSLLGLRLSSGTGTNQNYLSAGFTGNVNIVDTTQAITTTWTRYSFTGTVGSTATQIGFFLSSTPTGTAGANDWFEVTGLQLEIAGSASAYSPNTSTQALELAACQRYFEKSYDVGVAPATVTNDGAMFFYIVSSGTHTQSGFDTTFKVTKRATPTMVWYSPNNGASGNAYSAAGGVNVAVTNNTIGTSRASVYYVQAANASINTSVHFTANSEL